MLIGLAALAAACGGGGGGSLPAGPTAAPTSTPGPVVTVSPGPTAVPASLTGAGYALTFTVPAVTSGGGKIFAYLSATPPTGIPAPQLRTANFKHASISSQNVPLNDYVYLIVSAGATTTFAQVPSFVYTLPQGTTIAPGATTFVAFYDPSSSPNSPWVPVAGPGVVSGQTVSFPSYASALTFTGGNVYVYALLAAGVATPTPSTSPSPTPVPSSTPASTLCASPAPGTFPIHITNNTGLSGAFNVYFGGQNPTHPNTEYDYVASATAGVITPVVANSPLPAFTPGPDGCIDAPMLVGARIYVAMQGAPLTISVTNNANNVAAINWPNPFASAPGIAPVYDFFEYTWTSSSGGMNLDVSQVDGMAIPIQFQAANASGALTQPYGMMPHAGSSIVSALNQLGGWWPLLAQQTSVSGWSRITSPKDALPGPAAGTYTPPPPPRPTPPASSQTPVFDPTYFDAKIALIWATYTTVNGVPNYLHLSYPGQFTDMYGLVDPSTNVMNFYAGGPSSTPPPGSAIVSTIAYPSTTMALANNGSFENGNGSSSDVTANYIGRALSMSIDRGTLPLTPGVPSSLSQPLCGPTDYQYFYGGSNTAYGTIPDASRVVDWYAALMHAHAYASTIQAAGAPAPYPGLSYALPDDDECPTSSGAASQDLYAPDVTVPAASGTQFNITLNPF